MATAKVDSNTAQVSELYQTMQDNVFRGQDPNFKGQRLTIERVNDDIKVSVNKTVTFNGEEYRLRINGGPQNPHGFIVRAYLIMKGDTRATSNEIENSFTAEMGSIAYHVMAEAITDQVNEHNAEVQKRIEADKGSSREVINGKVVHRITVRGEIHATGYGDEDEDILSAKTEGSEKEVVTSSRKNSLISWLKSNVLRHF
ncbi:MAG: hypothetical protein HAW66_00920 [Shewanella sp.]|nr:hypothetical protein [Shewanella sp.]